MSGFRHGMVVGKFYPPHRGHEHLIRSAAAACDRVTVIVAPSPRESISLELRLAWLREIHEDQPHVTFAGRYDDIPIDYDDPAIWDQHCAVFREALGPHRIDAVFSSEDYGNELARRFGATHVSVDQARQTFAVSGMAIRADPVAHWDFLAPAVRAWFARRVIVVGAESTGTTTMARALARHFKALWVPEYGRELTEKKLAVLRRSIPEATVFDLAWDRADFAEVARKQNEAEDEAARAGGPILFGDTDSRTTAIWEERYLGSASPQVLTAAREPDLYLLTGHLGVPFADDGLRDGEHLRAWMTNRFRESLSMTSVPVIELQGSHSNRLAAAVEACEALLAQGWHLTDPPAHRRH